MHDTFFFYSLLEMVVNFILKSPELCTFYEPNNLWIDLLVLREKRVCMDAIMISPKWGIWIVLHVHLRVRGVHVFLILLGGGGCTNGREMQYFLCDRYASKHFIGRLVHFKWNQNIHYYLALDYNGLNENILLNFLHFLFM